MSTSGRMTETKIWHRQQTNPDLSLTQPANRRLPVVYYLSRNGQLEHPHFMEVPLSSPNAGLFLRDVIARLNVLRGKGMPTMYSWSCKRSYKNGFVWHDLSENDFIHPAHGQDYVLKGSELLESPPENQIAAAEPAYPRPSDRRRRNQSCSSIEYDQNEYCVYKAEPSCRSSYAADASTQTDDARRRRRRPPPEIVEEEEKKSKETQRDEIEISISPPPSESSPETLETLLKADGLSMQILPPAKTVHRESTLNIQRAATTKSSVLMQLISCGSLSFKDCGAGQVVSHYRMRVPRGGGGGGGRVKLEGKEYFSGSFVETKKEALPRLKRCSSYNADRCSVIGDR